jgi:hypothetical protein
MPGASFNPEFFDDAVAPVALDNPEIVVELVTDPRLDPRVVAPAPVQVVIVALTVATPPSYKLQVKFDPLTGVARPPGLFVKGSVPFFGIFAASKNWLLELGPGDRVKLYGAAKQLGVDPSNEEQSAETRWWYPRLGKKCTSAGLVDGQVLKKLNR